MNLKDSIVALVNVSSLSNKEVCGLLDEVRALYHDRKNVGDKVVSGKEHHLRLEAEIYGDRYPLTKEQTMVFYKGGWRKVHGIGSAKHIVYLSNTIRFKAVKIIK